jgi:D-lactate dehydrogenase
MKTIFFEWADYEQLVTEKYSLNLPKESKYMNENFEINNALGFEAVSIKTFSRISHTDLDKLKENGCKIIALRVAGFNMLDVDYATKIGLKVCRVSAYSPESIAEFAFALILNLARKISINQKMHKDSNNERKLPQMGFLLHGKTLGLHGYGKIARDTAKIARDGFGMKVLYFDPFFRGESPDTRIENLKDLYASSNIVSIHVPLNDETKGSVNKDTLQSLKPNFMLINTSRGPIVNSSDVKELWQEGKIEYLGVDVWDEEDNFVTEFLSETSIQTPHVAFFTEEAVLSMVSQTLEAIRGNIKPENILPICY